MPPRPALECIGNLTLGFHNQAGMNLATRTLLLRARPVYLGIDLAKHWASSSLEMGGYCYPASISWPFKENEREASRKEHSLASATRVQLLQGLGEVSWGGEHACPLTLLSF